MILCLWASLAPSRQDNSVTTISHTFSQEVLEVLDGSFLNFVIRSVAPDQRQNVVRQDIRVGVRAVNGQGNNVRLMTKSSESQGAPLARGAGNSHVLQPLDDPRLHILGFFIGELHGVGFLDFYTI